MKFLQKIKKYRQEFKFDKSVFLFTLFPTVLFLINIQNPDFSFTETENFVFSEATFNTVDIKKRINFFYSLIFWGSILICLFYLLSDSLFKLIKLQQWQKKTILIFACAGIFSVISTVIGINSNACSILIAICIIFLTVVYAFSDRLPHFSPFKNQVNLNFVLASALLIFFFTGFFSGTSFYQHYALWFSLTLLTLTIFYIFVSQKTKLRSDKINLYLTSLSSFPVILFFTLELLAFIKLKYDYFISHKLVFLISFGFVFLGTLLIGRLRKKTVFNPHRLLNRLLYPSIIITIVMLSSYSLVLNQPHELFELANPANAMMKIFDNHELPMVDFMSSHMLYEQWTGIIYNLVFGYNGSLDFLTYSFLNLIIFYLLVYYFLGRLLKNRGLALLFIILIPFSAGLFSLKLFPSILILFATLRLLKKQTIQNYILVFATIIFLIIWKLDIGAAALFSSLIFIPLSFFVSKKRFKSLTFGKSIIVTLLIVFGVLSLCFLLRSPEYIYNNFKTALHYVSANQAHGYSKLAKAYPQQFWIYHVILPALSALSILYILIKIRINASLTKANQFTLYASLFFFIIFIANAQRGLVRHSFKENNETFFISTFFLAASLLVFYWLGRFLKQNRFLTFYSSAFVLYLVFKFFPLPSSPLMTNSAISSPITLKSLTEFKTNASQGRVINDEKFTKETYIDLKAFLDQNLTSEQSFIDFSNTPMLYYYCKRNSPGYFCQNLQNTVDDYLQLQLIDTYQSMDLPVVIFSHYPFSWFDKTDGVPNTLRYYLIAEYIFSNYKPFAIINRKSIWTKKGTSFQWHITEKDTLIDQSIDQKYKHSARHLGQFLSKNKTNNFNAQPLLTDKKTNTAQHIYYKLTGEQSKLEHAFLKLKISTERLSEKVPIHLWSDQLYLGKVLIELNTGIHDYAVRLSNHYQWYQYNVNRIVVDKQIETTIIEAEIIKDIRLED